MTSRSFWFFLAVLVLSACGTETATETTAGAESQSTTTEQPMSTTTTIPPVTIDEIAIADSVVIEPTDDRELAQWSVLRSELLVDVEPTADLIFEIPQYDDGHEQVNIAISEWMAEQTDWWVDGLAEFPPVQRDDVESGGNYELYFDPTLETEGLASFRWNWYEYVCCRPYPNHGNKALVLDLESDRIIPTAEILDLDRLEEIHTIWSAHAAPDTVPPSAFETDYGPGFSSLALTPIGIEFGTDRTGPYPGSTTVVPYEALGDLVNAELVARAQVGGAVAGS